MAKFDFAENAALVANLTGTKYVALLSAAPTDSQTGSTLPELSGNGYARQSVTFTISGSSASNAGTATFTASGGNWVQATHVAICDSVTGGNARYYSALTNNITLNSGEAGTIPVGGIVISED